MVNFQQLLRIAAFKASENSTTILSGAAVIGVIATAALAVRATPKACELIAQARDDKEYERASREEEAIQREGEPLTRLEAVKAGWKPYIPAAVTGIATIACIVGSNQIGLRRNAALLGAYALAETTYREYREEAEKVLSKEKIQKIDEAVAERKLRNMPVHDGQVIITGRGDQLCFDSLSGRYFQSDIEDIRRKENDFNKHILTNVMYASLNDWWADLGLEPTALGDRLGFNVDKPVDTIFTSHLASDGRPCIAVGFKFMPTADFGNI